ncbi:MAG: DUF6096 family protein [Lachnospiraceae bacterium]|nr:DUF6096 family protein [Lachnospiraceae bacterium]
MQKLEGLDEDLMQEEESEKVTSFEEEKKKRKPFHFWTVGEKDFKMKLNTSMITKLENKYRQNIITLVTENGIPPLSVMLTVAQAAIVPWEHKFSYEKVKKLFDAWVDEGGSQMKFYTDIIMPTLAVSGFFTPEQAESMLNSLETAEDLI